MGLKTAMSDPTYLLSPRPVRVKLKRPFPSLSLSLSFSPLLGGGWWDSFIIVFFVPAEICGFLTQMFGMRKSHDNNNHHNNTTQLTHRTTTNPHLPQTPPPTP
jgi:hypothetical protein